MRNVITISRKPAATATRSAELANRLGYTCINRSFVDPHRPQDPGRAVAGRAGRTVAGPLAATAGADWRAVLR
ncbi:MAG: hypothetical protein M5U09_03735 [Gammaproteobacteria bacterium]|nr:hypothetical protein [Gammaproteobacteria bacterium]